ncbi:pyridoxal phosphate-dependent aminotransferase [Epibacterium sp. SM1969]|uniref:Pyridoxal phosphate-dependent aminotransferase n=1 Tax=Tritonibacter aquimaris TaxID=2663379 RepID=A0A844AQZ8_9RHOB|nr:pyridoxal phosphate-dependent aminotransferase [Tritonibacter aquimaris]MQY43373.1 pyridoxal phosphate-dependent aminotransferase [Tritonibacter aquimaris]
MTGPRYTPLVAALPETVPFVGPEELERRRGVPFAARLGANENGFGPVPAAVSAMSRALGEVWKYGDATSFHLRATLAQEHRCEIDNIVVGEGIDGLLGILVRLLIGAGDKVVTSLGAYPTFNYHVAGCGGVVETVPYLEDHEDPKALFAKAREVDAKLVYLANPDNPMGSWHPGAAIAAALEDLPEGCLLILDEAYVECAPAGTAAPISADDPRVIRMRTFSKAYGMAGLRIGYAVGHMNLIRAFDKLRNHFGVNLLAQTAAQAAVQDRKGLSTRVKEIATAREQISTIARDNKLMPLPSATNFVTIDCGFDGEFAKRVMDGLFELGCFVRMPFAAPQNRCIRVSCGPADELETFSQLLPIALKHAMGSTGRAKGEP